MRYAIIPNCSFSQLDFTMKIALIHDYLNQYGGAERVLEAFLAIFPYADVYTLFYDKKRMQGKFENHIRRTSFLDSSLVSRYHRPFIPLMPLAVETLKLDDDYDLVISDSAGYAKGISVPSRAFHLSYCYTPLRYAWELDDYFTNPLFKTVFRPAFSYLKHWDFRASQKPHAIIAISDFIAGKIKDYYGREAPVLYPPVDAKTFFYEPAQRKEIGTYYLAVGRLLHYKRFDLIIEAFARIGAPLKIVGVGPEEKHLKSQIANLKACNIELLSFIPERNLRFMYQRARALIFPQVEDFGLVAAEAQACGTPVIAYRAGGALEIVREGETGFFFDEQKVEALQEAVRMFETSSLNRRRISASAERFSFERFKRGILREIPRALREQAGY